MEVQKPKLPQNRRKKEKILNFIFVVAIILMLVASGFFFWKAFSKTGTSNKTQENKTSTPTQETTPKDETPQKQTYTVQKGDTLWKIANQFKVSVEDLKTENNLKSDIIQIGQELIIPQSSGASPTPTSPDTSTNSQEELP